MTTEADIAAKLDSKAAARAEKRVAELKADILLRLTQFGADTGPRKTAIITALLAGDEPDAIVASLAWIPAQDRAALLKRLDDQYLQG